MKDLVAQQTLFQVMGVRGEQDIQSPDPHLMISHYNMYFEEALTMK